MFPSRLTICFTYTICGDSSEGTVNPTQLTCHYLDNAYDIKLTPNSISNLDFKKMTFR